MTDSRNPKADNPRGVDRRDAVRQGYDNLADAYDDHRSPGPVEREAIELLLTQLGEEPAERCRLIDLGCGAGRGVLELLGDATDSADAPGSAVCSVGLDVSAEQLRRARARVSGPHLQGDMTALPFGAGTVDALTAFHAIIHVPREEHAELYREFARVLRPGGWLLITVGAEAWEGTNDDWLDAGAAMHWSFPELGTTRDHLATAGFEVLEEWAAEDESADESWPVLCCRLGG